MLKLWVGGIIDAYIANSFRELRNTLQQAVNTALHNQHYGDALGTWDVVIAVCSRPPSEHVRYSARTKETDIRVVIDHALFEQSSLPERANLLAGAVLDSLPGSESKPLLESISTGYSRMFRWLLLRFSQTVGME
jgi:hypothetical protein